MLSLGNRGRFAVAAVTLALVTLAWPGSGDQTARAQRGLDTSNLPADAIAPPRRTVLRFVTEGDYPPYNYFDEDRVLTGFNVSVARAICLELDVTCEIEPRDWDALVPAVNQRAADAIVASIAKTPQTLEQLDFSHSYHFTPARFVARRNSTAFEVTTESMVGRSVAVVGGTAHEAFLRTYFPDARIVTFAKPLEAHTALRQDRTDLLFGDAATLAIWMNGTNARGCCVFRGEAYAEPLFFGDGISVAVRKGDRETLDEINKALGAIRSSRRLEEIFLQFFPVKIY
ncbi:MAG: transporter substrate-binding domain-containing protein [Pseudomonadota bacterium]